LKLAVTPPVTPTSVTSPPIKRTFSNAETADQLTGPLNLSKRPALEPLTPTDRDHPPPLLPIPRGRLLFRDRLYKNTISAKTFHPYILDIFPAKKQICMRLSEYCEQKSWILGYFKAKSGHICKHRFEKLGIIRKFRPKWFHKIGSRPEPQRREPLGSASSGGDSSSPSDKEVLSDSGDVFSDGVTLYAGDDGRRWQRDEKEMADSFAEAVRLHQGYI
jgi:hypothetical protein